MKQTDNHIEPWERQQGEGLRAYTCFSVYRDMPYSDPENVTARQISSGRSAARTAKQTGVPIRTILSYMRSRAWTSRALAYDAYMDARKREQTEAAIIKMHRAHVAAGVALMKKAMRRLEALRDEDISAGDVVRMIDTGVKIERLARGESTSVQQVKADVKQTAVVAVQPPDLSKLTSDELDELEALCRKTLPGA